jgi:UPF0755 protein
MAKRSPVKKSRRQSSKSPWKLWVLIGVMLVLSVYFLQWVFGNVFAIQAPRFFYYTSQSMSGEAFVDSLDKKGIVKNAFILKLKLSDEEAKLVKPGLYMFPSDISIFQWKSFYDYKVDDFFEYEVLKYRQRKNAIKDIAKKTNVDINALTSLTEDEKFIHELGYDHEEVFWTLLVPGIYYLPHNMTAQEVLENLKSYSDVFWNEDRRRLAQKIDLSPSEVMILASIVYAETKNVQEMPHIAGVYINRLNDNMKLQADPTTLFAAQDFTAQRVTKKHLQAESEYNTYLHKGLPPGPICVPSLDAINAVLHASEHEYYYFCAKDDFSGCHQFAETFEEHQENAQKLWGALDKRKIK